MNRERITPRDRVSLLVEMRAEMASKIAAHAPSAGKHETVIPGLVLYRRTAPTPCYPASYEPSLVVFVQGRKRVIAGKAAYLCDESNFLLSSVQVPLVSQIIEASEEMPSLAMFLRLDLAAVREILAHSVFERRDGSPRARGVEIGKTTPDLLQPCSRLLDLLDAPADIPFLSNLIQREIVYRLLQRQKEIACAPSRQLTIRATEPPKPSRG